MKSPKIVMAILATVGLIHSSNAQWNLSGNSVTSGQFLGTTNDEKLEFKRNNSHIFSVSQSNAYTLGWLSTTNSAPNGAYSFSIGDFRNSGGHYYSNNAFAIGTSTGTSWSSNSFVIGNNVGANNATNSFAIGNDLGFDDDGGNNPAIKCFALGSDIYLEGQKRFVIGSGIAGFTGNNLSNGVDNSLAVGFNSNVVDLTSNAHYFVSDRRLLN